MLEKKYLDNNGLTHLWLLLKEKFIRKEYKTGSETEYKTLSDNNLTDELVEKINNAGNSNFTGNYEDLTNAPDLTVFVKTVDMNTAISNAVANINKKQIVETIQEMTDANTIYLMLNDGTENNIYDEYIVMNGKAEKIGTTEVDLSNYVQKDDLVTITNAEIDEILAN